jgi:Ca2+-binding EF-hand superfamily protein
VTAESLLIIFCNIPTYDIVYHYLPTLLFVFNVIFHFSMFSILFLSRYMSGLTAIYARKDTTSGGGLPVAEKAAKDRELRLKKRWQALKQMHRIIRLPQNRKPGLEDITNLCETFEKVLLHNDDPLICDRDTFVRVIMQMYIKTDHKSINQLYSSLDPDRTDRLDYRDFIACLRIFRVPTESDVSKLKALWNIYGRINGLTNNNECKLSKNEIKQILFTCTATLTEKELLDDAISAKVGKQLRAETKLHQRQQYVNRESFLGLAYVECSGIGACLGGGQRSMSGKTSFGIKLSFDELLNALNERLDVETQFYNQLILRLKEGGFEGEPAKRRKPPPEKIDTSIPNPSAERLKVLMSSPSHTI